ncbi:MAG: VTT domain-containing protein [Candidatus Shapirobacteria bacterium]
MHWDIEGLIRTVGYVGIFGIVFAESGLLFGFFFPGDSLLLTAGLLASRGYLNIYYLVILSIIGAIGGDTAGYWIGHKWGRRLFEKKESLIFKKKHLEKAEDFYRLHGGKAIVIARFMPIIRTFVPIMAGVAQMHYDRFVSFNVIGGILWVLTMGFGGYLIGTYFPGADKYFHYLVLAVIFVSLLPSAYHFYKEYGSEFKKKILGLFTRPE